MTTLPLTGAEPVDQLLEDFPQVSSWLNARGVICTQCGEAFWGPLSELCRMRGIEGDAFAELLSGLNEHLGA